MADHWEHSRRLSLAFLTTLLLLFSELLSADEPPRKKNIVELSLSGDFSSVVRRALKNDAANVAFALNGLNLSGSDILMEEIIILRPTKAIGENILLLDDIGDVMKKMHTDVVTPEHQILISEDGEPHTVLLVVKGESVKGFFISEDNIVFTIKKEKGSPLTITPSESFPSSEWTCTALEHENKPNSQESVHSHNDGHHKHSHGDHHHIKYNSNVTAAFDTMKKSLSHHKRDSHIGRRLYCELNLFSFSDNG